VDNSRLSASATGDNEFNLFMVINRVDKSLGKDASSSLRLEKRSPNKNLGRPFLSYFGRAYSPRTS